MKLDSKLMVAYGIMAFGAFVCHSRQIAKPKELSMTYSSDVPKDQYFVVAEGVANNGGDVTYTDHFNNTFLMTADGNELYETYNSTGN